MEASDKCWVDTIASEQRYIPAITPRNLFNMGFRAALEWTLNHREIGHNVNGDHVIPCDIIEKELED